MTKEFEIKFATVKDIPIILKLIKELAEYEKLLHEVVATEKTLEETLFGKTPYAEVLIGYYDGEAVGYALFFYNFSTFLAKPGIHLEDLYITPKMRGKGFGK